LGSIRRQDNRTRITDDSGRSILTEGGQQYRRPLAAVGKGLPPFFAACRVRHGAEQGICSTRRLLPHRGCEERDSPSHATHAGQRLYALLLQSPLRPEPEGCCWSAPYNASLSVPDASPESTATRSFLRRVYGCENPLVRESFRTTTFAGARILSRTQSRGNPFPRLAGISNQYSSASIVPALSPRGTAFARYRGRSVYCHEECI
jgi:hypothetical protein